MATCSSESANDLCNATAININDTNVKKAATTNEDAAKEDSSVVDKKKVTVVTKRNVSTPKKEFLMQRLTPIKQ